MELTPKQQAVELIRQADKILLVTGREPNNDQVASLVALQLGLSKMGKQVQAVITDKMPKAANVLDTRGIARDLSGVRDFVVSLNLDHVAVDKLKYNIEDGKLNVVVTPHQGNFEPKDASFAYGAYQFDLVIAVGVTSFTKIDRLVDDNPTIFDGLHVINLDYHRINDNWGSVNLLDQMASCTSEMLVGLLESLEQNVIDANIATALLTGIMAATNRFTGQNTTPKAMTVAAQLMAGGARQQEIVKALYDNHERGEHGERAERGGGHTREPQRGGQGREQHEQYGEHDRRQNRQARGRDVKKNQPRKQDQPMSQSHPPQAVGQSRSTDNQHQTQPQPQPNQSPMLQRQPQPINQTSPTSTSNTDQSSHSQPNPATPASSPANPSATGEVVLLDRTPLQTEAEYQVQTFEHAHAGTEQA